MWKYKFVFILNKNFKNFYLMFIELNDVFGMLVLEYWRIFFLFEKRKKNVFNK